MQKITPFLWFNNNAEEAANYYAATFKDFKVVEVSRYGDAGPGPKGSVMTMTFQLFGQEFIALNGGPHYTFSMAISFMVKCQTQAELDGYWDKLSDGGTIHQCGWLTDKFGLTWQIVPIQLGEMLKDKNHAKVGATMQAMFTMKKLDIAALKRAYDGA